MNMNSRRFGFVILWLLPAGLSLELRARQPAHALFQALRRPQHCAQEKSEKFTTKGLYKGFFDSMNTCLYIWVYITAFGGPGSS